MRGSDFGNFPLDKGAIAAFLLWTVGVFLVGFVCAWELLC